MKFKKNDLNLEQGLQKEWIITNGIGGYASSTIIGANTRKYHGLMVVPLYSPGRRMLVLSKLDESITINEKKHDLYTNICKNYVSQGFKYLESFQKDILPIFKYKVENTEITKTICMQYERNTVIVYYKIRNGNYNAKLQLAPVFNFRDFHLMNTNHNFNLTQEKESDKIKLIIDNNTHHPIYMKVSDGKYTEHSNDIFNNMFYIEEEKRGFFPEENHIVSGVFDIDIEPNEEKNISFICSMEENIDEIDYKQVINNEIIRINNIYNNSFLIDNRKEQKTKEEQKRDDLAKLFMIAGDNFVVYRPTFGLHSLIAGYPWFLDWGRDSLISLEGLCLIPKRYDIARDVLLTCTRDIKYGLIPNGYSEIDNSPLYNSADASLLLFEQVEKYLEYTDDHKFIKENIYPKLKMIIEHYSTGIDVYDNNIHLEEDGLISSGTENTQNTWMDAKYGDLAFTPRCGKVVEINALWYNALKIMEKLTRKYEKIGKIIQSKKYAEMAEKCKGSFNVEFYNSKKKCLYDVVGDNKVRPNQLFALSLTYPVVDPNTSLAENIITVVEKKLLNNYGLKTLAKGEKNYIDVYEGDNFKRDASYHQGITWPWLLGLYYNALKNIKNSEKNKEKKKELETKIIDFKKKVEKVFSKEIVERGCIGSIAEIYDSRTPYLPKGAFAQGWSVAEIFRIIFK
ncbi:MAG TPA: glycogen debranching protein [Clostridiales bacterium]|nr:glycogen debranching protein [Clostridiales bacterium]